MSGVAAAAAPLALPKRRRPIVVLLRRAWRLPRTKVGVLLMLLLVVTWLQRATEPAADDSFARTLTYLGLALLGSALVLVRFLPSPDPAPAPGQSPDQWGWRVRGD